jgi:hypothetical protein
MIFETCHSLPEPADKHLNEPTRSDFGALLPINQRRLKELLCQRQGFKKPVKLQDPLRTYKLLW